MRRIAIASGGVAIAAALVVTDVGTASAAVPATPAASPARPATPAKAAKTAKGAKGKAAKRKKYYVAQGPRFNLPTGNAYQQGAIDTYVKKLIRHAPAGSEIDVSLFRLQTDGMARELVRAHKRKAKVRVVIDSDSLKKRGHVYTYLRKNLGSSTKRRSWILTCPKGRGCIAPHVKGQWSKNHNKFYAFSRTYDSRNVVVQTSGNATGGMYNQYNDAYTMVDAKLYTAYRRYFYDLAKRRPNGNYYRTRSSGMRSVSYFPKASGDPIVDALKKVSCKGGTRLRLSSGMFTRTSVSRQLSKLDDAGCDVKVVSGSLGESAAKALAKPGPHGGPAVHVFTPKQAKQAHSKYLLIDGVYAGHRRKMVMTGSHSYTTAALRLNDESMLTIPYSGTYGVYLRNFNRVYAAAYGRLSIAPWNPTKTVPDNAVDPENEPVTTKELNLPETEAPATP
ncbi:MULTISPECIES: phospholipase D-like domain-containing protein [Actinomadura]|uniref:phospholipase D n=1 Tax=Actinomadura yumaensis TaxID=111807 RepID=A0ABW2CTE8_9ACTN|nr:phospholipase D-like domain-containing protein [Actinomadura sp. J1-007]MWK35982.1 hypothetical protein [Actinomadura sp. J1-007]